MEDSIAAAAQATAFPVAEARDAIKQVKQLADKHPSHVQYWCLTDNSMWPKEVQSEEDLKLMHTRLFAAVRLVYEYQGPASRTITNAEERIENLKDTILLVARTLTKHRADLELRLRAALGDRVRELDIKAA